MQFSLIMALLVYGIQIHTCIQNLIILGLLMQFPEDPHLDGHSHDVHYYYHQFIINLSSNITDGKCKIYNRVSCIMGWKLGLAGGCVVGMIVCLFGIMCTIMFVFGVICLATTNYELCNGTENSAIALIVISCVLPTVFVIAMCCAFFSGFMCSMDDW